uniref:Sorting nexin-3 n=1 Tax=Schistocephalus solidus TaxID=70667 RepID=A0A183SRK8_SCHSO
LCVADLVGMMSATQRLESKQQTLEDAYSPPANFLEIDVCCPELHGEGKNRYVDYEVKLRVCCVCITLISQTNLPVFRLKESSVRRRYSDFEWLRTELDRESKIIVPKLPGKAWKRQLPFRADDGIFDVDFIDERRKGLESFINK